MANLTVNQKRCQDCACLVVKNGQWVCDECFGQAIEEIDDCPESVTVEELDQMEKQSRENKQTLGARADSKKTDSKPKTVKVSDEKRQLFDLMWEGLSNYFGENAQILTNNKLISVKIGEKTFKVDLIEKRKSKV